MNSKVYKWCMVPLCKNTSKSTPGKLFVYVPHKQKIRDEWLTLARRSPTSITLNSPLYICEDHFDLPNDMENYMKYKVQGYVKQIRMKKGCVPSKFHCQGRIHLSPKMSPTDDVIKRQQLIEEALREYEANVTVPSTKDSERFGKPNGENGKLQQEDGCNLAKDSYVGPMKGEYGQIVTAEWPAADRDPDLEEPDGNMMEIKTEKDDEDDPLIKEEPMDINEHPPETELANYAALYFKMKDELKNLKTENQRLVNENHRLNSKLHYKTKRIEKLRQQHEGHYTINEQQYLKNIENVIVNKLKEDNRRLAEQNKSLAENIDNVIKQNHIQMKDIQDLTLINSNLSSKINELTDSNQRLTKTIERLTRDYAKSIHGDLSSFKLIGVIKTLSSDNETCIDDNLNNHKLPVDIARLTKDKAKSKGDLSNRRFKGAIEKLSIDNAKNIEGDLNNSRLDGATVKLSIDNAKSVDEDLNNSRLEGDTVKLTRDNAEIIDTDLNNHKLTGVIETLSTDNVKSIDRDVNNCGLIVTIDRLTTHKVESIDGDPNVFFQEESDNDVQRLTDKQKQKRRKRPRNILVTLCNPRLRDTILSSAARYNKAHPKVPLKSSHLGHQGETTRIYVTGHLSPECKILHKKTRQAAIDKKYKYVWIKYGRIYVRKDDQSVAILIKNEDCLSKL